MTCEAYGHGSKKAFPSIAIFVNPEKNYEDEAG